MGRASLVGKTGRAVPSSEADSNRSFIATGCTRDLPRMANFPFNAIPFSCWLDFMQLSAERPLEVGDSAANYKGLLLTSSLGAWMMRISGSN